MSRLNEHLAHIQSEVVPQRGAAQNGLSPDYVVEIEARAQPPLLVRGLEQWNAGRFYDQHETLEWLWRATPDPVRDLLKGIIQGGVGAYHVQRHNRRGALGKWTGATGYLEPFIGHYPYGIDTTTLRSHLVAARFALLADEGEPPDWVSHEARAQALAIHWSPRPAEPRVTNLLRRLDRAWQESEFSVEAALAGLDERTATPAIRERATALGTSKLHTAVCCFGAAPALVEPLDPPAAWPALLRWLTHAHETLREPLGFLTDAALPPLASLLEATIEQDFYRAGQIAALRE